MKRISKKALSFLLATSMLFAGSNTLGNKMIVCACEEQIESQAEMKTDSIYIVYTNDFHSYVANTVKAESGETVRGLRISNVAQMAKDIRSFGNNVLLVDAGDEIQGNSMGSIDEGSTIIDLMNAAGYQLATLGNHEFDYGVSQLFKLAAKAEFPYLSCNFGYVDNTIPNPFAPYKIYEFGDKKLAVIGITTPETITSSTPTYFQDENGNYIYTIAGVNNPNDLYNTVQATINSVKDQADYIIALGHVGVGLDEQKNKISSYDLIENTVGLDAFIDAHSHSTLEYEIIKDKAGNEVVLTQTGYYLNNVGLMEIKSNGEIATKLLDEYSGYDPKVAEIEDKLVQKNEEKYGQKIATLDTELYINNANVPSQRIVRAQETNAGDFAADSFYWYFNEAKGLPCDVILFNGGGVRSKISAGNVTGKDIKDMFPFGNMVCLIKATGQQIKDCLETGATVVGEWDFEWDSPAENGAFMHVAGLKYTIDTNVKSSVVLKNDMFDGVKSKYRVKDIQIYNREKGAYEDIDLKKEYYIGGTNYILRNNGNGMRMFENCDNIADYVGEDYDILKQYVESFSIENGYHRINTASCPLSKYTGYLLNYENPEGAGRITINK